MNTLKLTPLTEENFRKYGTFVDLTDDAALAARSVFPSGFFADVVPLTFGGSLPPTVSVNSLQKADPPVIRFIEFHHHTCEGILPLDCDVVLFVGLPEMGKLSTKHLQAFVIPQHTFVCLNPLIIHGSLFCLQETGHSLCLLSGRTFANDFEGKLLGDDAVTIELD